MRTALILGATGLIGGHALDLLLEDPAYGRVVTLGRRPLGRSHPKLAHHVVDFDQLEAHAGLFVVDDVFCCLGTTWKKAGSKEAFRRVDLDYPRAAARLAHVQGAEQYLLVSSLGASRRSPFFYTRVKGEAEVAVQAFSFYGCYVFRPSLLLGERKETRPGERRSERLLDVLSFLLIGPLKKYEPIEGRSVAAGMIETAKRRPGGQQVYETEEIRAAV